MSDIFEAGEVLSEFFGFFFDFERSGCSKGFLRFSVHLSQVTGQGVRRGSSFYDMFF